jgi:cellulose synthase/poly-beta-1,6-N-acetylglucosamine synthase-like glycosyltransferase
VSPSSAPLVHGIKLTLSFPLTFTDSRPLDPSLTYSDSIPEFISQRRRWSNGSYFAALHATLHYYRVVSLVTG